MRTSYRDGSSSMKAHTVLGVERKHFTISTPTRLTLAPLLAWLTWLTWLTPHYLLICRAPPRPPPSFSDRDPRSAVHPCWPAPCRYRIRITPADNSSCFHLSSHTRPLSPLTRRPRTLCSTRLSYPPVPPSPQAVSRRSLPSLSPLHCAASGYADSGSTVVARNTGHVYPTRQ